MTTAPKPFRQSVSLPARLARRVRTLAHTRRTSTSRVIAELVESGLDAREQKRKHFLELADRLAHSTDTDEQHRLKEELARLTFGG
jgi:metal-responsive CopG/Arc/MetJ family transcriptional regulator